MIHKTIDNIKFIKKEVDSVNKNINIIAISKTFPVSEIMPLVNSGHQHFGENKVQEAVEKWTDIKSRFSDIKLHLVGRLQANKVKFCLPLFDYIHSLDNERLAEKISNHQEKKKFKPKIFIQVNFDNEKQKGGIDIKNLEIFVKKCLNDYKLNIIGLMCIPPNNEMPEKYFKELRISNELLSFTELSMGMSIDYKLAIENDATYLRIGSKIFGDRTNKF